jgi:hypothetical protein
MQYISNKGAVNELNKNNQKKENFFLPYLFKKGSVNKLNENNEKIKITQTNTYTTKKSSYLFFYPCKTDYCFIKSVT